MVRKTVLASALFLASLGAANAQEEPTLTIYTYDAFAAEWGPGPQLKEGFEQTCACTLNWVAIDSSIGALRRVQLEGDTTDADIILGLDTSIAGEALATGLFATHNVDTTGLKVPNYWKSDSFVPFDYGYFAFVYNKELMPNPPHSFEDLALGDTDIQVIVQDPRSSTPGLGLVLWLKAAYHDDTEEAWPDIASHITTVTKGWSESYNLFLEGEADMVLSYTTSPAYHLIAEEDERFASAPFDEGHYLQIEIAGILNSSPNKELANQFLTYLISNEAQAIIPTTNWMYPVAEILLPSEFYGLEVPSKVLLLDDEEVASHSTEWAQEMLDALGG